MTESVKVTYIQVDVAHSLRVSYDGDVIPNTNRSHLMVRIPQMNDLNLPPITYCLHDTAVNEQSQNFFNYRKKLGRYFPPQGVISLR